MLEVKPIPKDHIKKTSLSLSSPTLKSKSVKFLAKAFGLDGTGSPRRLLVQREHQIKCVGPIFRHGPSLAQFGKFYQMDLTGHRSKWTKLVSPSQKRFVKRFANISVMLPLLIVICKMVKPSNI